MTHANPCLEVRDPPAHFPGTRASAKPAKSTPSQKLDETVPTTKITPSKAPTKPVFQKK